MTFSFGTLSMCTAAVKNFSSLIVMRLLLGASESGVIPFITYVTSVFYSHDSISQALAVTAIWSGLIRALTGMVLKITFKRLCNRFSKYVLLQSLSNGKRVHDSTVDNTKGINNRHYFINLFVMISNAVRTL